MEAHTSPNWWTKVAIFIRFELRTPSAPSVGSHPSMLAPCCWLKFFVTLFMTNHSDDMLFTYLYIQDHSDKYYHSSLLDLGTFLDMPHRYRCHLVPTQERLLLCPAVSTANVSSWNIIEHIFCFALWMCSLNPKCIVHNMQTLPPCGLVKVIVSYIIINYINWEEQDCRHLWKLMLHDFNRCNFIGHHGWNDRDSINQLYATHNKPHETPYFLFYHIWGRSVLYWSKDNPGFLLILSDFNIIPSFLPIGTPFSYFSQFAGNPELITHE